MNKITKVERNSLAEEMEIEVGDELLSINQNQVKDLMDYLFLMEDDYVELEIKKKNGETWILEIEKEYDETLGIDFENPILDQAKHCHNKCIFCFIDQLPCGMRESLYFKDDDSRLSFLQGNFVTLTNLNQSDLERIVSYGISPINVSVHATDPEIRVQMLKNPKAAQIMEHLEFLTSHDIEVNAQVVLCPGYNDGETLSKTLSDLMALRPKLNSVAVVPIGRTRFRENLVDIPAVNQSVAMDTIQRVNEIQEIALRKEGTRFVFLADEFYIKAERDFPPHEAYEGYLQFEDGVGMIRKFSQKIQSQLQEAHHFIPVYKHVTMITGEAAYKTIKTAADQIMSLFPELEIDVQKVTNQYFGEEITVVGLITGEDIKKQVKINPQTEKIFIPESMLRVGEDIFLDDITLNDLESFYHKEIKKLSQDGTHFIQEILLGGTNE